jgi:exodeoxyribonuclease-1
LPSRSVELFALDADTIRQRLFTRSADLPEGVTRLPIKSVHLNKSPMLVGNLKTLSPGDGGALGLDLEQAWRTRASRRMGRTWRRWAAGVPAPAADRLDVDEDLYGGFVSNNDRRRLESLRARRRPSWLPPVPPSRTSAWPSCCSATARAISRTPERRKENWEEHRAARLFDGAGGARTVDQLFGEIDALSETADERGEEILGRCTSMPRRLRRAVLTVCRGIPSIRVGSRALPYGYVAVSCDLAMP